MKILYDLKTHKKYACVYCGINLDEQQLPCKCLGSTLHDDLRELSRQMTDRHDLLMKTKTLDQSNTIRANELFSWLVEVDKLLNRKK